MVELRRELGLKEVVATIVTGVIGGGLFISAIQIQSDTPIGSGIILAFILAAIPSIIIAMCYAVLAPIFPKSGGEYVFVSRILDPYIGFIATWARWFAMIATIAAMAVGDVILIQNFFNMAGLQDVASFITVNIQLIAIVLVLIFLIINDLGIKIYGRVQTGMFVLLMIGIGALILFGLPHVSMENLSSSFTFDVSSLVKASSLVFFGYIGFAAIANAGGEVKNPEKVLPKGIIISMLTIAIMYVLVVVVTYGSMSPEFYASYDFSTGSIPDVMSHFLPGIIALYVAFAGAVAIISDINPNILATSRLSFAWAKDKIVPQKLAELNRHGVPRWTLLVNGVLAIAIILLANQFMAAVMMINMAVLLVYLAVTTSALILPYKHPEIYRKATFKFKGLWIAAVIGMTLSLLFFGVILRLPDAFPGFILLVVWSAIGTVVYVLTLEHHKTYWKVQKQQRKEKDIADKELIKQLVDIEKEKISKKKK